MDKKLAAENLLEELLAYHGPVIRQVITFLFICLFIFWWFSMVVLVLVKTCRPYFYYLPDETNGGDIYQACRT